MPISTKRKIINYILISALAVAGTASAAYIIVAHIYRSNFIHFKGF